MSELEELIERLEKADGPDREIDALVFRMCDPEFVAQLERSWEDFHPILEKDVPALQTRGAYVAVHAEHYTASLDSALALVERKLPDWFPGVQKTHNGWSAEIVFPAPRRDRMGAQFAICSDHDRYPNPALALCLALCRALTDTKENTDG